MRRASIVMMASANAFFSLALAGDLSVTVNHPALAGYCVQSLRHELSLLQQALSSPCGTGITQQECDQITSPVRTTLANAQRTFNLWRVYGLGLGPDSAAEVLRGVAEANADIAYLSNFSAAHPLNLPSASEQDIEKAYKDAAASDPRLQAIHDRITECQRGPPL